MTFPTLNVYPAARLESGIPGKDLMYRTCIVRLGPDLATRGWYTNSAHASLGIVGLTIDYEKKQLVIESDFDDDSNEVITEAVAGADATLSPKLIIAGASGGSRFTKYTISSAKPLVTEGGTTIPAGTVIAPHSTVFSPTADNIWIRQTSLADKLTP